MRLDRFLSTVGLGTRKDVKKLIKEGRIAVNDEIITDSGYLLQPEKDIVKYNNQVLFYQPDIYLMLYKPAGYLCSRQDNFQKTVMELISHQQLDELFIVGRLDKDTEGLLLITNDGKFCHHLTSSKHHVDKRYYVEFSGLLNLSKIKRLEEGVIIDGYLTKPAKIEAIGPSAFYLIIQEGKFHQVKKMLQAVGLRVTYLKRVAIGLLSLDENLQPGQYRPLTSEEITLLKK